MNFFPKILKLSLIVMLVLILVPVAIAGDSDDVSIESSQYKENDVCIHETIEIDHGQSDVSSSSDNLESELDHQQSEMTENHFSIEENDEVSLNEYCEEYSLETNDFTNIESKYEENNVNVYTIQNVSYYDNGNISNPESILENISVNKSLFFISSSDLIFKYEFVYEIFNNEISVFNSSENEENNLIKELEFKDSTIFNQGIIILYLNNLACDFDIDGDLIVCINKSINDFIYSINNRISDGSNNNYEFLSYSFIVFYTATAKNIFDINFLSAFKCFGASVFEYNIHSISYVGYAAFHFSSYLMNFCDFHKGNIDYMLSEAKK